MEVCRLLLGARDETYDNLCDTLLYYQRQQGLIAWEDKGAVEEIGRCGRPFR
jgi:hypothetical protein